MRQGVPMLCRRTQRMARRRDASSLVSTRSVGTGVAFYQAVKRHFMSALVLTFCMSPLQSATLERLSLDDMIAKSTVIVRGKVTSAYAAASGPIIYPNYTVQVSQRLKG